MLKSLLKIFALIVFFFISQLIAALACGIISGDDFQMLFSEKNATLFATCWTVTDLLLLALLWLTKLAGRNGLRFKNLEVTKTTMKWAILAQILMLLAATGLLIKFDLDTGGMEEFLEYFIKSPIAIIMIVLVGPLLEEVIFRDGIIGALREIGLKPWFAVILSAVCFGVVHGNVAQFVNATFMGVLLGLMYVKTNDLSLCLPAHIINNGLSVLAERFVPDEQITALPTVMLVGFGVVALLGVVMIAKDKLLPPC